MPIRRLPESLINRIAAGEVVERPASAVKELVENSLDAGAGRIDIIIRDGGQTLIAVSDDGCGLDAEELALAVERHATSKLPDDDLIAIRTLGFRGEALPSIAAVARLTLTSRRRDADDAWSLTVDAGHKEAPIPAAHPEGTRVEVRDLFYATPARLKFLKTPPTEYAHAVEAVERLAMAHPRVAFTLGDGARTSLKLPATSGSDADARRDRLARLLGHDFTDNAVALAAEREGLRLSGLAGLPTLNRRNTAQQFLVVNGRPVRDRLLFGAVRAAYQDLLASDRHPIVALFLELPPDRLDVNVHPMKTEVRFREAAQVRGLIVSALRHALAEAGHRASTTVARSLGGTGGGFGSGPAGGAGGGRWPLPPGVRAGTDNPGGWPVGSGTQARTGGLAEQGEGWQMPLAMPQVDSPTYRPPTGALEHDTPGDTAAWAAESGAVASVGEFPLGAALAQLHGTFILARTRDGLVIVDQHAAHERLTHERLIDALANGPVPRQALLLPEVIELDTIARDRVIARAADLTDLGLMVEPFGEGAVVVREVPAFLGAVDVAGLVKDLAADLAECDEATSLRERLSEVCATMACHSSVRAGDRLSIAEMNALLRSMEDTPHSGQCSHGRPTYVELKLKDIERLFGRR